jgi:hypothetical protein
MMAVLQKMNSQTSCHRYRPQALQQQRRQLQRQLQALLAVAVTAAATAAAVGALAGLYLCVCRSCLIQI